MDERTNADGSGATMTLTMEHDPEEEAARTADEAAETADEAEADDYSHLDDLADGAGCTEIWEHLSDSREE
ncbi:hypothetical protein [Halobellus salinisoli]|uniref:hypothetical protein n=1 Tax=Halobellus salinisoli TaxID=3108500 RepID=UPI00300BF453